jgi:uncharacterized protein
MSSENLHAPRERLSRHTIALHQALTSLIEELEAADWYRQRADDTEDEALKELLLHNMREEMEHASMLLEWIRRHEPDFDKHLRTYLFTDAPILEIEVEVEHGGPPGGGGKKSGEKRGEKRGEKPDGFTIGRLREE